MWVWVYLSVEGQPMFDLCFIGIDSFADSLILETGVRSELAYTAAVPVLLAPVHCSESNLRYDPKRSYDSLLS